MTAHVPEPVALADHAAWVGWHLVRVKGEARKVPLNPITGTNASVSAPGTWGTLAAARRIASVRALPGVGIVSAAVPVLAFFDLDRCLDRDGRAINDHDAARLLDACADTYGEITPSGAGVRIVGTAADVSARISRKGTTPGGLALEIYKAAPRYLTVTGLRYGKQPDTLSDIGDVVLDMLPLLGHGRQAQMEVGTVRRMRGWSGASRTGEGFHAELCALAARYISRGMSADATAETLRGLMLAHPEAARDYRWRDRFAGIRELATSAAGNSTTRRGTGGHWRSWPGECCATGARLTKCARQCWPRPRRAASKPSRPRELRGG